MQNLTVINKSTDKEVTLAELLQAFFAIAPQHAQPIHAQFVTNPNPLHFSPAFRARITDRTFMDGLLYDVLYIDARHALLGKLGALPVKCWANPAQQAQFADLFVLGK